MEPAHAAPAPGVVFKRLTPSGSGTPTAAPTGTAKEGGRAPGTKERPFAWLLFGPSSTVAYSEEEAAGPVGSPFFGDPLEPAPTFLRSSSTKLSSRGA